MNLARELDNFVTKLNNKIIVINNRNYNSAGQPKRKYIFFRKTNSSFKECFLRYQY